MLIRQVTKTVVLLANKKSIRYSCDLDVKFKYLSGVAWCGVMCVCVRARVPACVCVRNTSLYPAISPHNKQLGPLLFENVTEGITCFI